MNKNRGNIFKPFDALEGYNEEIKKKEIVKVEKPVLTPDRLEELEAVFQEIELGDNIFVKYYKNNAILDVEGNITKIDVVYKKIIVSKVSIPIENIIDIKRL